MRSSVDFRADERAHLRILDQITGLQDKVQHLVKYRDQLPATCRGIFHRTLSGIDGELAGLCDKVEQSGPLVAEPQSSSIDHPPAKPSVYKSANEHKANDRSASLMRKWVHDDQIPCPVCGTTKVYLETNQCVACVREEEELAARRRREEEERKAVRAREEEAARLLEARRAAARKAREVRLTKYAEKNGERDREIIEFLDVGLKPAEIAKHFETSPAIIHRIAKTRKNPRLQS